MCSNAFAEELFIEAKDITLNKEKKTSIFQNDVLVKTKNKKITSQYAEYNKNSQEVMLKENIIAQDNSNNLIKTGYAKYNNISQIFETWVQQF